MDFCSVNKFNKLIITAIMSISLQYGLLSAKEYGSLHP